jgi:hypothetical protein
MAPEAVPVADVRQWRWRTRPETRPGPARYLRHDLDRAGCDLLTICDITGHSYRSAQTIVKHYRARNADRADAGIDRLELQVRKEGMKG